MDAFLEYARTFLQQTALTLSQAEFMVLAGVALCLFISQTKSTSAFYGSLLSDKNEILQRQNEELEKRRGYIEEMEKVILTQQKLIKDLSASGVIHRIVIAEQDGSDDAPAKPVKH